MRQLWILLGALPYLMAAQVNISHIEYFIDSDPGIGNATAVSVTPASNLSNVTWSVDLTNISDGLHQLYVRSRTSTGVWSLTQSRYFLKVSTTANPTLSNVDKIEYFVDNDPGIGYATSVSIGTNPANVSWAVDMSALSTGIHYLYVRSRTSAGVWSLSQYRTFLKVVSVSEPAAVAIDKAEYFINNDPGVGNGINIPLVANTNLSNLSWSVDLTDLNEGWHVLYTRTRTLNGVWSVTQQRTFYKAVITPSPSLPLMDKMEYFVDNDPGTGNALPVPISTPNSNLSNVIFSVDVNSLSEGWHVLYVRTRSSNGNWSVTQQRTFYKAVVGNPNTTQLNYLEYYIDTDPGQGLASSVPISGTEVSNFVFSVNTSNIADGFHTLGLRARNSQGTWSILNTRSFYKTTVLPLPNLVPLRKIEYFVDADPGACNGTAIPFNSATTVANLLANINISALSEGRHWLYLRAQDSVGGWSLVARDTFTKPAACPTARDSTLQRTFCGTWSYRLPSGRTVNSAGAYLDTLRYPSRPSCDSIRFNISLFEDNSCRCSDSLQLVALYDASAGDTWTNRGNWKTTNPLQTWYGVSLNATGCVQGLNLSENRMSNIFNISNFNSLQTLNISKNRFTFEDILPNLSPSVTVIYAPQDSIFNEITYWRQIGDNLRVNLDIDPNISTNEYKWFKVGNPAVLQSNNHGSLILNNLQQSDTGVYFCQVTNAAAPLLTLYSRKITLNILTNCRTQDSTALAELYLATRGTGWRDSTHWLTIGQPISNWYGVRTNTAGCVDSLGLSHNQLTGNLPNSIGNLTQLQVLELANNNLEGKLPETIGNLRSLRLFWAAVNRFTDTLPESMSQLTQLQELNLTNNQIRKLPSNLSAWNNLLRLEMNGNLLDTLPPALGQLQRLTHLHLAQNRLRGNIPAEIGNLSRLQELQLFGNQLTGAVPAQLGNLSQLKELLLNNNQLTGAVPAQLGNLYNLKTLYLHYNQLTGEIPIQFQNLRALNQLYLQANQLDSLPSLSRLSLLTVCSADKNQLTFDDILPNIGQHFSFTYTQQDSIGRDTSLNYSAGSSLILQFGLDEGIANNQYSWFKDGQLLRSASIHPLTIHPLRRSDTGAYNLQITNSNAPSTVLKSRLMRVAVTCPNISRTDNRQICAGRSYTLPSGAQVSVSGIYRDTLASWLECDSIIITQLTVLPNDTLRTQETDCALTQMRIDTFIRPGRATNGCDSVIIRTRLAGSIWNELPLKYSCYPSDTGRTITRIPLPSGCDSIVAQWTALAPRYARDSIVWVCDPREVRRTILQQKNQWGCDSITTIRYILAPSTYTVHRYFVCYARDTQTHIKRFINRFGCDSVVEERYALLEGRRIHITNEYVCDTTRERRDTSIIISLRGCDSLAITQYIFNNCACLKGTSIYNGLITNDGDGKNDVFVIDYIQRYQPNELTITDQRGMIVYQTQNYRNNWSGRNQRGEPLPEGIYQYVFRTRDPLTLEKCMRTGFLTLQYVP